MWRRIETVLSQFPNPMSLADPKRFKTIQDLTQMRPDCGASIDDILVINNEALFIIDPLHLGTLLNPYNSPPASYVRTHGVVVVSYVKNESFPILWSDPFLLLPTSLHLKENFKDYLEHGEVLGSVSCPSGSFLFLVVRKDIPPSLGSLIEDASTAKAGMKIKVPNGTYRVFYEQFKPPEDSGKEFYQNIVVQKQ